MRSAGGVVYKISHYQSSPWWRSVLDVVPVYNLRFWPRTCADEQSEDVCTLCSQRNKHAKLKLSNPRNPRVWHVKHY